MYRIMQHEKICWLVLNVCVCVPAVGDDGPSVRGITGFDPAEEVEEWRWIFRNTMIWPGSELELPHLSTLTAATLKKKMKKKKSFHFTCIKTNY